MGRQLKHEEIADLLGAYALDAVEPDEAELVEAHLATCPRCRDEVRDHREVASLLAYSGAAAPPGLWDSLAAALEEPAPPIDAPTLAPVTPIGRPASRLGRRPGVALLAAAPRRVGAQEVDGAAVRLGEQERAQRAAVRVEAVGFAPQAQEHLLDDLLGRGVVGEHPSGQPVDGAGMTAVRFGERVLPPAADGDDQRGVAHVPRRRGKHAPGPSFLTA
jgi:anti-sigma factor RsiW